MRKRDVFIAIGVLLVAAAVIAGLLVPKASPTASWGLSYPQPGKAPVGPDSSDALQKLDAAYMGNPEEKVLYLTFDSGYENGCTEKILDVLKAHNVPAAFFLVGHYMEQNPDLVRRMVAEGHIVGNHTVHHYNMDQLSEKSVFQKELQGVEELFKEITGKELPRYYRPPQGLYSKENLKMAQQLGYKTVFWSLAYVDWNNDAQPSRDFAMQKLLPRIHNGGVILLHSTSQTNAEILDEFLTTLEKDGYRFGTVDELFS